MTSIDYWGDFLSLIQTGTTYTSPNNLNSNDFPSITGSPAEGPMFPNPNTAVPSVTIADNLDVLEYGFFYLEIYLKFFSVKCSLNLFIS